MTGIGNKEVFAKNLSYYLQRCGKDQKEIAEIVGVAPSTFNEWVKAKKYPRIDKIEILANYFGVLKSDLIEEKTFKVKDRVNRSIGKSIQTFREKANMSTQRLSELLNIDEKDVFNIENGSYSVNKELLFRICDVFQTTPDVLDGSFYEMLESGDPDAEYRYSRQKNSPTLNEGEKVLIDLFRRVPEDKQELVLQMIRVALNSPKQ